MFQLHWEDWVMEIDKQTNKQTNSQMAGIMIPVSVCSLWMASEPPFVPELEYTPSDKQPEKGSSKCISHNKQEY